MRSAYVGFTEDDWTSQIVYSTKCIGTYQKLFGPANPLSLDEIGGEEALRKFHVPWPAHFDVAARHQERCQKEL
jgi:hypothetical protein